MIDEEGYISIMARSDDVINVAAHRFSTGTSRRLVPDVPCLYRSRFHTHYSILTCYRRDRTGHNQPSRHSRSSRRRHPRPTQRPPPVRLRRSLNPTPPPSRRTRRASLQGGPKPSP
jgi:hypothetical protein